MGLMSLFKITKQSADVSKFNFPNDNDLDVPPPPPSLEDTNYDDKLDISPEKEDFNVDSLDLSDFDADDVASSGKINSKTDESSNDDFNLDDLEEPVVEKPIIKKQAVSPKSQEKNIGLQKQVSLDVSFVLLDDYRLALNDITTVKTTLTNLDHEFARIHQQQPEEDTMFKNWHSQANDILRKLTYVDNTLFEKNR